MTDANPNKTKPVYKIKTSPAQPAQPAQPPVSSHGQARRADQREDQREDRREDRRENQREDQREAQRTDRREDRRTAPYDNRNQDPNHPANRTQAWDPNAPQTQSIAPDEMLTEQEKDASGPSQGVGPVTPAEVSSGPVETIEEQGIGPRTPYPTGNPPGANETTSRSQAVKGSTDKPGQTPSDTKGPVGATRRDEPMRHGGRP
jgi:hypothetical protein